MTASKPTKEKRKFHVDQHILVSIIKSQSGSLQKAMMEAVANSMDAGAKKIEIEVTSDKVILKDDGRGFKSKQEIEQVFEVFGFDHSKLDRSHGRFGVGRGQLFCYGVNHWRTNTFEMEVDIETNGVENYDLTEGLKPVKGVSIEIGLYAPLSLRDAYELEEAFKKLVKYSIVPVTYNGTIISKDPRKAKWTEETDEAWFNLRKDGQVHLYSQGLYVDSPYGLGVGGDVVTKPGKAFALNLARNDILKSECTVWPKIQKTLRAKSNELSDRDGRQNTLNASQRRAMAQSALEPENVENLLDKPLFTFSNNKHVSLRQLLKNPNLAVSETGDRMADVLQQQNTVNVLTTETLERFGVDSMAELEKRIKTSLKRAIHPSSSTNWNVKRHCEEALTSMKSMTFHEDLAAFDGMVDLNFREIPTNKLTADEKLAVLSLRKMNEHLCWRFSNMAYQSKDPSLKREKRTLKIMESESAAAQTDGRSIIWFNRDELKKVKRGLSGFFALTSLLVHEYVHCDSSQGSHLHDQAFFETFHDVMRQESLGKIAVTGLAQYIKHAKSPNSTHLTDLDLVLSCDPSSVFLNDASDVLEAEEAAETPVAPTTEMPQEKTVRRRRARAG